MSHADKRTPVTDALETLGMIHFKPEKRDAIHLAVEPVVAATKLAVSQSIGIYQGYAYPVGKCTLETSPGVMEEVTIPYHGIVDPFLPKSVREGVSFWFVMAPRMVQSLRHVWEHPDFPAGE